MGVVGNLLFMYKRKISHIYLFGVILTIFLLFGILKQDYKVGTYQLSVDGK